MYGFWFWHFHLIVSLVKYCAITDNYQSLITIMGNSMMPYYFLMSSKVSLILILLNKILKSIQKWLSQILFKIYLFNTFCNNYHNIYIIHICLPLLDNPKSLRKPNFFWIFYKTQNESGKVTSVSVLCPRSCKRSDTLFQKSLLLFLTWREYFYSQPTHFSSQPKK